MLQTKALLRAATLTFGLLPISCATASSLPPKQPEPTLPSVLPVPADAFVDSIGVNTHLAQDLTGDREYAVIVARVKELGIRHVRDGIFPSLTRQQIDDQRRFFAQTNVDLLGLIDCPRPLGLHAGSSTPPKVIRAFDAAVGRPIAALEGPNEPNLRQVENWAPLTRSCIARDDRHRALPVPFVAPAIGFSGAATLRDPVELGNISRFVNLGAIHRYVQGRNPGTPGYWRTTACGRYESIVWNICEAQINAGARAPIWITETGYTTSGTAGSGSAQIGETVVGKYISRVLLIDSLAGVTRTYLYELHDDRNDPANPQDGYGLLRYDGSAKPSFYAVRSMVALLADPGPVSSPTALRYAVSGPPTIRNELFEKRDGTYFLAMWNERPGWNPATGKPIPVPPAAVTFAFANAPLEVRCRALDDAGTIAKHGFVARGKTISTRVSDRVVFLSFRTR